MKVIFSKTYYVLFFFIVIMSASCSTDEASENEDTSEKIEDVDESEKTEEVDSSSTDEEDDNTSSDQNTEVSAMAQEILNLINTHRESIGKDALVFNTLANTLAKEHTEYMIAQDVLSHDGFQERSQRLNQEEQAAGTAENVASRYNSAQNVVNAWLGSTRHKQNIEGNYTHTGISAIQNNSGTYFFTQIFLNK